MFSLIEALRYRCLRDVRQRLLPFQILVGPNASGKSTFLDVPKLLRDLLNHGLAAVHERSPSPRDLVWMGEGVRFELAVELAVAEDRRAKLENGADTARYEVAIGEDAGGELAVLSETFWLKRTETAELEPCRQLEFFPDPRGQREMLVVAPRQHAPSGWRKVVHKSPESANDYFHAETTKWQHPFRLGPRRLALANLPEDEEKFPVATWAKRVLMEGVQRIALHGEAMRRPSPPAAPKSFQPDGSSLPWVIDRLKVAAPHSFQRWLEHVRTALPEVLAIDTVERAEDKSRYLVIEHQNGLRVPSWAISDGTLRLLALTLLAYAPLGVRVFLVEEPEDGIHPLAVECVFQSLSSVRENQILCASHSPVILALAQPAQILCFARTDDGVTDVARGDEHPRLKAWKQETDLGTLFAAGVLG